MVSPWFPSIKEWWLQVTVTPELNKIKVFNKGTCQGLKVWIPTGGQIPPISTVADKLLWKKAQKKDKKKKISEIINNPIPHRIPNSTIPVWIPW